MKNAGPTGANFTVPNGKPGSAVNPLDRESLYGADGGFGEGKRSLGVIDSTVSVVLCGGEKSVPTSEKWSLSQLGWNGRQGIK